MLNSEIKTDSQASQVKDETKNEEIKKEEESGPRAIDICQTVAKWLYNQIGILKLILPFHRSDGSQEFLNKRMMGFSVAVLAGIATGSYFIVDDLGKVTLVLTNN